MGVPVRPAACLGVQPLKEERKKDIELVRQCADDSLKPDIIERFVETVGVVSS
jgi:hypothetical protein